jgi:hypothetical protein
VHSEHALVHAKLLSVLSFCTEEEEVCWEFQIFTFKSINARGDGNGDL